MCRICRNLVDLEKGKKWAIANPEKAAAAGHRYELANNEKRRRRWHEDAEYRARNKTATALYRNANRAILAERQKAKREARWRAVISAYGGHCACCGEEEREFLALDHVNGGGHQERKTLGPTKYYTAIFNASHPDPKFRILCHNCNMARGFYGYCPHERKNR